MNADILISFIVPIYNSQKYLEQCLNSLCACPLENVEFLLINDGSVDLSENICLKAQFFDQRVRYFSKKNEGVSVARNYGIVRASGKYVFFLDADDYLLEDCWSTLEKEMEEDRDFIIFNYIHLYENGTQIPQEIPFNITNSYTKDDLIKLATGSSWLNTCWGKLIKRELLYQHSIDFPKGIRTGEDALFILSCVVHSTNCKILAKEILMYRHHPESVMKSIDLFSQMSDLDLVFQKRLQLAIEQKNEALTQLFYKNFFSVITNLSLVSVKQKEVTTRKQQLHSICNWDKTNQVLLHLQRKEISPFYKKIELILYQAKNISVLSIYFRMKNLKNN